MSGRETKILIYTLQISKKKIIPCTNCAHKTAVIKKIISHIFRNNLTNITTVAYALLTHLPQDNEHAI
jgi:hypothetical protein